MKGKKRKQMNRLFYENFISDGFDKEKNEIVREYYDVFLSDLCGCETRNIAIISNRIYKHKGRKYLDIVGLDISTGKIISLIDNHGRNYGLCSYSEDWAKLKTKTVIKVPVELCENVFIQTKTNQKIRSLNTLRIKGKFEILGKTNWVNLKDKYEEVEYLTKSDSFKLLVRPVTIFKVFELFKNCKNSLIYIPVRFPGTHYIKVSGSKVSLYNPETRKSFNFISATKKLLDNSGKYMDGIVIAKVIIADNKITVLINNSIICEYYQYSKTERNNNFFKQIEHCYDIEEVQEIESYPVDICNDYYPGAEDDYSDKYRLYDSMEEYCDEYEALHDFEMNGEDYFGYEDD